MPERVWFSEGAQFRATLQRQEDTFSKLRPFVRRVASRVLASVPLPQAALEAAQVFPTLAPYFDLPSSASDLTFGLRAEHMYGPAPERVGAISFSQRGSEENLKLTVDDSVSMTDIGDLIRGGAGAGIDRGADVWEEQLPGLLDELQTAGLLTAQRPEAGPPVRQGITRLQHAGLAIRCGDDVVLVDPGFNTANCPGHVRRDIGIGDLPAQVRAIALSHSHDDHVHISTLLMFPRDTPILLPEVPCETMLCPDLPRLLRELGFSRVHPLPWYGPPFQAGRIEVRSFPFYGEQPLASERWRDLRLRNWGNTYHIRTDDLSALILIDSGNDVTGRMAEVAQRVVDSLGAVDLVLSNVRQFHVGVGQGDPFYITGAGQYWLALTEDQMARFPGFADQLITLGPDGVAEVARICKAQHLLPYAHWWNAPGEVLREEVLLAPRLEQALRGSPTSVLPWAIGDTYSRGGHGGPFVRHAHRPDP
jgi:L-ascorbate metabolism protein UlaG (beta-lactamase superfamily)